MTPSDVHQDERSPGARKRKSWEQRHGRMVAGRQRLRAQSASNYTELGLGKSWGRRTPGGFWTVQADLTSWEYFWIGM